MRILLTLALVLGLFSFVNAQTANGDNLHNLKGKVVLQKVDKGEFKIFFQIDKKSYQTKINNDNSFEIKLPKGIYQVILANEGGQTYSYNDVKIGDISHVIFDLEKADSSVISCPTLTDSIETTDIKLSSEIVLKPVGKLPKAKNKNNKGNKNK